MQQITFRHGNKNDIEKMTTLDRLCFEPDIAFPEEVFLYHMTMQPCYSLVAEVGEEFIGFIILNMVGINMWEVTTINVTAKMRNRGCGSELLLQAEAELAENSATAITLHVDITKESAMTFYEKRGYKKGNVSANYYGFGKDGVAFKKELLGKSHYQNN